MSDQKPWMAAEDYVNSCGVYSTIREIVEVAFLAGAKWSREQAEARFEKELPGLEPRVRESLPDDIRAQGWSVAVHNDYRQEGKHRTFWLFTKGSRAVKGEAMCDRGALNEVRERIKKIVKVAEPE
jgi:hypothetical protein